ncbi:hypothetical protein PRIPAC_84144 [Pristionchus pacificus]|uniref:Uncharacterized protein n=1 Tax=Pristionchus pacificus TaxID=54126 RepID=A0A2A6BUW0_PRIPA|nr:hypothetical protein PRIPAC_84144 [Pristionchus pacificus]|eukprot:PDM69606.1 hypothetical protein PRIPAC_44702 [Pristionchus pacificus]
MFPRDLLLVCLTATATAKPALSPKALQAAQSMEDGYKTEYKEPLPSANYKGAYGFASNLMNVAFVHGATPYPELAETIADKKIIMLAEAIQDNTSVVPLNMLAKVILLVCIASICTAKKIEASRQEYLQASANARQILLDAVWTLDGHSPPLPPPNYEERTLSGGTTKFMKNLINVVRVQGSKPFPWVTDGDDYVAQLAKAMNGDKSSA